MSYRATILALALVCLPAFAAAAPSPTAPVKREVDVQPSSQIEAQALLLEYERAQKAYERIGVSMRDEIERTIRDEAERRIKYINQLYDRDVAELEEGLDKLRDEAIRHFARFVKRYPDNPVHTPDALFRLAELYYEKAQVDYIAEQDSYEERRKLYERGKLADEPEPPEKRYDKAISTLSALVHGFKDYRFADAALYLLGFTLVESGEDDQGRKTYLSLIERFPKSKYTPESLLRLGELEFELAEFEAAASYYKKVLKHKDSDFYDLALYKLGWSYYQLFDYDRAIGTFKDLIAHYDEQKEAGKGDLKGRGGQLRAEAIEYVAKALAEDDWDGDGEIDPNAGPGRTVSYLKGKVPFEREILAAHADVLYDQHTNKKYAEALKIYEKLIESGPTDPENPRYHERVIAVYDTLRDRKGGAQARAKMSKLFGKGTRWHKANRDNPKAIERATMLVEVATHQRAQFHHLRAQELKLEAKSEGSAAKLAESAQEYKLAAAAYADYLEQYPKSKKRLEVLYYRAEALYYAGDYDQAARVYGQVRDDEEAGSFREEAAFSAIKATEKAVAQAAERGRVPRKGVPGAVDEVDEVELPSDQEGGPKRVQPEPIPPLVDRWMTQLDRYVELGLERKDDPEAQAKFSYQAAEMLYRFKNFEPMRERVTKLIDAYPSSSVASSAAALIINSYKLESDWENIQKWTNIFAEKNLGSEEDRAKLEAALRVFSLGARFKTAEKLLEDKKFVEAASEFERLALQEKVEYADKALYNAATAYIQAKHYDKASKAFEIILTDKRFAKSEFREQALFQVAENSKKFFDFEKAISSYLALYRRYPKNENSPYSLFQAASLLDEDGRDAEAAAFFEEYTKIYEGRDDAVFALYRAANAWKKVGDERKERKALELFARRGRGQRDVGKFVLESLVRLGEMALKRNKQRDAKRYFQDVIALFRQRGYEPGSPESAHAARSQFELIELTFRRYQRLQLKGNMRQMGLQIQQAQALLTELVEGYSHVFPFQHLDWTFAAFFRIGQVHQEFAQKLYDAPEPKGLDEESLDIYRTQLEDEGTKWEDVAVQKYEEMIREARARKVTNDWVRKALVFLNKFKPSEYPLAKEEKEVYTWNEAWSLTPPPTLGASAPGSPPEQPDPLIASVTSILNEGDVDRAEQEARAGGDGAAAKVAMALVQLRKGDIADAREAMQRAVSDGSKDPALLTLYVRTCLLLNDSSAALSETQRLAKQNPDDVRLRNLALFSLVAAGRPAVVLREARTLLQKDETNTGTMRNIARAYLAMSKLDTARYVLGRAIEVKDEPISHRLLGEIAYRQGNLSQARAELEHASRGLGDAADVLNNTGVIAAKMADLSGAERSLLELTRNYPGLAFGHANLGYVYRLMGRPEDAERAYLRAVSMDPGLAEAHYNLGMLYFSAEVPSKPGKERFVAAIDALNRYRDLRRTEISREDSEQIDTYIEEAKRMIEMLEQSQQQPGAADPGGEGYGGESEEIDEEDMEFFDDEDMEDEPQSSLDSPSPTHGTEVGR